MMQDFLCSWGCLCLAPAHLHFFFFWCSVIISRRVNLSPPPPHCLKITQNVAFEFLVFWHFPPIFVLLKLTCLVTLFDHKL